MSESVRVLAGLEGPQPLLMVGTLVRDSEPEKSPRALSQETRGTCLLSC